MFGPDTPFEFYIANTMRGGVGGVDHEICNVIFLGVALTLYCNPTLFPNGAPPLHVCTHTESAGGPLKGEVLQIATHAHHCGHFKSWKLLAG